MKVINKKEGHYDIRRFSDNGSSNCCSVSCIQFRKSIHEEKIVNVEETQETIRGNKRKEKENERK